MEKSCNLEYKLAEVVVTQEQIRAILIRLAAELTAFYRNCEPVLVLLVLEGARRFGHDLLIHAGFRYDLRYVRAKSYNGTQSNGTPAIDCLNLAEVSGRLVLILDDIYDTGHTLGKITEILQHAGAAAVKTCVLLEKLRPHEHPLPIDFTGLRIPDDFVVGYGLDWNGLYRDLNQLHLLSPAL